MKIADLIRQLQEIQSSSPYADLEVVVSTNGVWDDELQLVEVAYLDAEPEMGTRERVVLTAPA